VRFAGREVVQIDDRHIDRDSTAPGPLNDGDRQVGIQFLHRES
jgi:hypothetical protein